MTTPEKPEHPVCPYCGSANVSSTATVRWHDANQEWEVSGVFDEGYCDDCNSELKHFNWVES